MSDKPMPRVMFGLKEVMTIMAIVFAAGGGWWMLGATEIKVAENKTKIEKVELKTNGDHDKVIELEGDVGRLVDDVSDIQVDQRSIMQEQRVMSNTMHEIYLEIKK